MSVFSFVGALALATLAIMALVTDTLTGAASRSASVPDAWREFLAHAILLAKSDFVAIRGQRTSASPLPSYATTLRTDPRILRNCELRDEEAAVDLDCEVVMSAVGNDKGLVRTIDSSLPHFRRDFAEGEQKWLGPSNDIGVYLRKYRGKEFVVIFHSI